MKTLGAIIRMCYGIGLLLCIVALFFPEGNVFRELAIYILLTVSVFNWYKEYKSKKRVNMKQKFNIITSTCVPLPLENVDTDQIGMKEFVDPFTGSVNQKA